MHELFFISDGKEKVFVLYFSFGEMSILSHHKIVMIMVLAVKENDLKNVVLSSLTCVHE